MSQYKWIWYSGPRTPRRPLGDLEVFDQASRSVWGSIVLLWRLKGRHLASFAAVLTIVGLAFDLFAQQVITIKARSSIVNITSDANLPQIPRAEALANISNLMTSTFYAGLLSVNATDIIPVCPTGNCTWPVVSSLAMCGGCTDVSAELTAAVDRNDVNGWHNYSLPDGLTLSVNGYIHNQRLVADRTNEVDFDSYSGYRYKSIGNDPENGYLMLLHFEVISFDPNSFKSATPKPPVAHECALWFCIQAYNVSMTNGQLTQSTIGSWRKLTPNHLSQSMMQNFTKTPAEFNVPPNAQFLVAAGSFFERLLDDVFPMSVEQSEGDNTYHGLSQGLWGSFDHRDSYIENFARGLTQAIRQSAYTSPLTDIYYLGTAFKDEVYVKVRWAWLAFPGFMLIGSCLLLLATVWRTGRAPVGPWKDNALALLFAGVDENVQSAARGALRRSGNYLGMAVGDERVRLSEMDGKWKFD